MKRILLAMVLVLTMVLPVMAQTPTAGVRVDSALQTNPYVTVMPQVMADTNYSGKAQLTVYHSGGELTTWGYSIFPNTQSTIGQRYDGQLFELDGDSVDKANWIHYFHSTREMTDIVNGRELQAKLLGWRYYDANGIQQPYQSFANPPVLYENIKDLYGQVNGWGGASFIYAKGDWTYPPRFLNGRLERREYALGSARAPEMRLAFQAVNGDNSQITLDQIESVEWIGKGFGTPWVIDKMRNASVSYNMTTRFWNPVPNFVPSTELHYVWFDMPDTLGPATFRITLKDGNVLPDLNTKIKSLNDLPAIEATFNRDTYNIIKDKDKSGKIVVKAELMEETVNNITVREIQDPAGGTALVIQWPEPDGILFGGIDMPTLQCDPNTPCAQFHTKVWVGAMSVLTASPNGEVKECFLWYDVPAQMGTVVVDVDAYNTLKAELTANGFSLSDLKVTVMYREYYLMPSLSLDPVEGVPEKRIMYINRAQSAAVSINTFE